jgi:hypothetical protein
MMDERDYRVIGWGPIPMGRERRALQDADDRAERLLRVLRGKETPHEPAEDLNSVGEGGLTGRTKLVNDCCEKVVAALQGSAAAPDLASRLQTLESRVDEVTEQVNELKTQVDKPTTPDRGPQPVPSEIDTNLDQLRTSVNAATQALTELIRALGRQN